MKTIFYAAAALAMAALVSCGNKEAKVDTTGAVPAKVINTMDETDIIISEDSMSNSDSAIPAVIEAVPDDVAEEINDNISEENKAKEKKSPESDGADDE